MSYIYNSYVCETCGKQVDYVWLLSDSKFEEIPDRDAYAFADHNKMYTKYEVCVKCPKCKSILCFEYSLDGKYIGKRV